MSYYPTTYDKPLRRTFKRKRTVGLSRPATVRRAKLVVPGYTRSGGYYNMLRGDKPELKFNDTSPDSGGAIPTAGQVLSSFNLIAQGTGENERNGRKCVIKKISSDFVVQLPEQDAQATPASGDVVRIIHFIDKQANGATAVVLDILETAQHQSYYNLSNLGRFTILKDETLVLNYETLASDGAGLVSSANKFVVTTFDKYCEIPIEFSSTTGVIAEIRSNNIAVLLISRSATAILQGRQRLRFADP